MVLRALRQPYQGGSGPSLLARGIAVFVIVGMVLLMAPVLVPVLRWFVSLF